MKEDKIINNSFNSGEMGYDDLSQPMKVDSKIADMNADVMGDILEVRSRNKLDNEISEIFIVSPYYEKYKNPKRVDKNDMIKMYYYFKDNLENIEEYTAVEYFKAFAEFFQINYNQLYLDIGVMDNERILREVAATHDKKRIQTKRLF